MTKALTKLRLLVTICNYGTKGLPSLRRVIGNYQTFSMHVDIVVVSEAPKDLGREVKVLVGLPSKDPWSLPFRHKQVLADNVENYDLFIYSEDDVLISEETIQAFLRASAKLTPDEIPGLLLYENDKNGVVWLNGFYKHFHWIPNSVRKRGEFMVAEFTNAHSACYLLTQAQLRRAIASGGYLRGPCEGLYDLLCTAATDPYTNCGLKRVICISHVEEFLVHHLPDLYPGKGGIPLPKLREQIQTLGDIAKGTHPACSLFDIRPKFWHFRWQKDYYEEARPELLQLVPSEAKSILSIGAGAGALEKVLKARGAHVTALPLDSVSGAALSNLGVEVVYATWEDAPQQLAGRAFDCVILTNLLHLVSKPSALIEGSLRWVSETGTLILGGPNFGRLIEWGKTVLGIREYRDLRSPERSGIAVCGPQFIQRTMLKNRLRIESIRWLNHELNHPLFRGRRLSLGKLTAREWVLRARRLPATSGANGS
jgi:2-polyprenyl-3-methyl-5-hydroxy-6-metoxy-1,4-benzoquinol methylase